MCSLSIRYHLNNLKWLPWSSEFEILLRTPSPWRITQLGCSPKVPTSPVEKELVSLWLSQGCPKFPQSPFFHIVTASSNSGVLWNPFWGMLIDPFIFSRCRLNVEITVWLHVTEKTRAWKDGNLFLPSVKEPWLEGLHRWAGQRAERQGLEDSKTSQGASWWSQSYRWSVLGLSDSFILSCVTNPGTRLWFC